PPTPPTTPEATARKFLTDLGMSNKDITSLITYNMAEVTTMMSKPQLIFGNAVPLKDASFKKGATAKAPPGYALIDWSDTEKEKFKESFARMVFLINSSKFENLYNTHAAITVDPQSSPLIMIPMNYTDFKSYVIKKTIDYGENYSFYTSSSKTDIAWGQSGLTMFSESEIGSPLLTHEMMHTVDFDHQSGYDGAINNIPYFVQTIIAYNEDATNACQNGGYSCNFSGMNFGVSYTSPPHDSDYRFSHALRGFYFNY
ncbi:hypothetical protein AB4238_20675, partial [Shewanella sp. 10N.286.45.A1]|uniref:hypothetical protein n=1 Tax=Shewanella sp. 10N.286.45.A1 TaxID=3229694 RepID=UPI00354C5DD0